MLNLDKTACCFLVSTVFTDSAVFLEVKKRRNDKNDQQTVIHLSNQTYS